MQVVPGFEVLSLVLSAGDMTFLRARRFSDGKAVVLECKALQNGRAAANRRHELALLRKLVSPSVVSVVDLVEDGLASTLAWEDFAGEPLPTLGILGRLPLTESLDLARRLVAALGAIHSRNVIHLGLWPGSFWWQPRTGELRLAAFSLASELSRQACSVEGPFRLPHSLVYVSPEQTGRLNRILDYRSDYYSLGVTLYELFSGAPPFAHTDPLELAHYHVAQQPPRLSDTRSDVPSALSDIVHKLLAKNPDDRYQSPQGLEYDLERVAHTSTTQSEPFVPGTRDRMTELRLPEPLYGREAELGNLSELVARVTTDGASLILLTGPIGVGKSALVLEACSGAALRTMYFASGRFEAESSVPYPALTRAFRSLLRQFLTEPDARVREWRRSLSSALTVAPEVLAAFCPELGVLLQLSQVAPEEPSLQDARTRYQQALREFACAVASGDRTVCLFLDDLQWADAASLEVIQDILHVARRLPLAVVAACRAEDSLPAAARAFADTVCAQGTPVHTVALAALSPEPIRAMLADALQMPAEQVDQLATLLYRRTAGNPFFLRTFLLRLWQQGLLQPFAGGWRWDLVRLGSEGITDNVVAVFRHQIRALPAPCRELLSWAACLDSRFTLRQLATVAECTSAADVLWPALASEILLPSAAVLSSVQLASLPEDVEFSFAHEHLRQALLDELDDDQRRARHWRIGLAFSRLLRAERHANLLFQTANHLGLGFRGNATEPELRWLAELCLEASEKALHTAAPRPALSFAETGLEALRLAQAPPGERLGLRLYRSAGQAAFLGGDFDVFESLASEAQARGHKPMELAFFKSIAGQIHYAHGRADQSIRACLEALSGLGVDIPAAPTNEQLEATRESLGRVGGRLDLEVERPHTSQPLDGAVEEAIQVLGNTVFAAYCVAHPAFPLMVKTLLDLSLEHGECAHSSTGYLYYGIIARQEGNYDLALKCGQLALDTAERFGVKSILSHICMYAHFQLLHWTSPLPDLSEKFQRGYELAAAVGSPLNASCNLTTGCMNRFFAGDGLGVLLPDMAEASVRIDQYRQNQVLGWHQVYQQTVHNLHQLVDSPVDLHGPFYDERQRVPQHIEAQCVASLYNYRVCKSILCLFFGQYQRALPFLEESRAFHQAVASGTCLGGQWILADCVCHLHCLPECEPTQRPVILERVQSHERRMQLWARLCPVNWEHKLAIIRAERARAEGASDQAVALYQQAVQMARATPFLQETALACELASQLHQERGEPEKARDYLRQALDGYSSWGAANKVRQMESCYARLLGTPSQRGCADPAVADYSRFSSLDLLTVLNASQAISREVNLEHLFARLIELVIDAAGADAGALLLPRQDGWMAAAFRGRNDTSTVLVSGECRPELVLEGESLPSTLPLCRPVVRYVLRTEEPLVIDDVAADGDFSRDPGFSLRQVKSLVCFPVRQQSKLVGIIYLENSLIKAAFTRERIHMLELLSAQAVISIQNARLYETLEQRVHERTEELFQKNEQLHSALLDLKDTQQRLVVQDRLASLGAMAAGIAHELRNPLNFIVNFARLAESRLEQMGDARLSAEQRAKKLIGTRDCVAKIREHSNRIQEILQSMLQHCRGETGTSQPTDINALVVAYINLAKGNPDRSSVSVALELEPGLPSVDVAPHDVGRALLNLINNACQSVLARKGMEPDFAPQVRVSTKRAEEFVEIRVWDNGPGIPESIGNKVFNPFFTTKPPGAGTGLGLSIAHDIVVHQHGGQLSFQSHLNDHCEFLVRLRTRVGTCPA